MTIHIDLTNYTPVKSESFRIEYWYNRSTRDWVVQVYDNNDIEQECQYCPDKSCRDHEIEYLSNKYNTTDIKKG